jgi:hypothetical protein
MAEYDDREHYIPLRKSDLARLLCTDKKVAFEERQPLAQFCKLTDAVFHFEYQEKLEQLKDSYAPFDPDSETRPLKPLMPEEREKRFEALFESFTNLLERANFKKLSGEEIRQALEGLVSDSGLRLDVDLGIFERMDVFVRGDGVGTRTRRNWWTPWKTEEIKTPLYRRMVLIAKLRRHRRVDRDVDTDAVYLKIFKNIPKSDLEMLLPGSRVKLSLLEWLLIAFPLASGLGLILYKVGYSFWESGAGGLAGVAVWSLAGALGGYGYKSYHGYQVKKQTYSLRLTRSLYFLSLDNNTGVLMRLFDEAEEQECRETYLAYFCLWKYAPPEGWTAEQLDDYVELYLEGAADLKVDFEIGDALDKLERLHIVTKAGDRYRAVPLDKALEMLDYKWDNYFKYANPEHEAPPVP